MTRALIISTLLAWLVSCAPADVRMAKTIALDTARANRCLDFHEARSKAHTRLDEIPTEDLERLHEINQAGRVTCENSLPELPAEVKEITARLP